MSDVNSPALLWYTYYIRSAINLHINILLYVDIIIYVYIGLIDDEDPDDVGIQGYLKISIQIVGPGDKMKIHNEEEDIAKELAKETAAGM